LEKSHELITQLKQLAFLMISKSGGARMMEAAYSLMQLAKHLLN
jgi:acetyl-CoA carboxylase beta subunit